MTRGLPFHLTTELGTKPAPHTVSVKADPPGEALAGTSGWVMRGTGFCARALELPRHRSPSAEAASAAMMLLLTASLVEFVFRGFGALTAQTAERSVLSSATPLPMAAPILIVLCVLI